jgi:hypothetical protein
MHNRSFDAVPDGAVVQRRKKRGINCDLGPVRCIEASPLRGTGSTQMQPSVHGEHQSKAARLQAEESSFAQKAAFTLTVPISI